MFEHIHTRIAPIFLLLLFGCEKPLTDPYNIPPLEAISFNALGSGKIAFQRYGGGISGVYVLDVDRRITHRLTDRYPGGSLTRWFNDPALAPDGDQILYSRNSGGGWEDVYMVELDGANEQRLTYEPGHERYPRMLPGGDSFVFIHADGDRESIYAVQVIAGTRRPALIFRLPECTSSGWLNGPLSSSSYGTILF